MLSLVGPSITRSDATFRRAISPGERLAITLCFLVTGDSMQTISFSYRVGHSTVCGIVYSTCESLWKVLLPQYMQKPSSPAEWERIGQGFEHTWNFPHCVGDVDGKHIVVQAPPRSGSTFYKYRGTHSVVLLAVCDAHYCFTLIDIGDVGVFSNSPFGQAMENSELSLPDESNIDGIVTSIPYFFVANAAFPLSHTCFAHIQDNTFLRIKVSLTTDCHERDESLKTLLEFWLQNFEYFEDL